MTPDARSYGFVCIDCDKRRGYYLTLTAARRHASDHANRCKPPHRVFVLNAGVSDLSMYGG